MGRTKRKRNKNKNENHPKNLDHDPVTINLKKFMSRNKWQNKTGLQLRFFQETGRGITSTITTHQGDILIKIPYNLMITYTTVINSSPTFQQIKFKKEKLKIHDCLALFLILEKHKKDRSFWAPYIASLPDKLPPLPWLLEENFINNLPPELRELTEKSFRNFKESWRRSKSIWCCDCKGPNNNTTTTVDCVLDLNIFTWAYVLVNTRAVYVKPQHFYKLCDSVTDYISDEPSLALCPFLDMFNHSYNAKTEAILYLEQNQMVYQLRTFTGYKKFQQIFISYGPHNNAKLLTEYGFFIPGNIFDAVHIQWEEVLEKLNVKLDKFQFRFIKEHQLDCKLYIDAQGMSFNLKGFLFVALNREIKNYTSFIYGGSELVENSNKREYKEKLLNLSLENYKKYLKIFQLKEIPHESFHLIISYLKYRIDYVKNLIQDLGDERG